MRLLGGPVLAACLWVLPLALGGDKAVAILACGMFDGTPGVDSASPDESP